MNTTKTPKPQGKLSRAQLREALDTVPVDTLFSPAVSKELTGKQKKFCLEVAKGETKANAYRKAYNVKSKHTLQREPYQLTRDQRITNQIEAMQAAISAQEYQTPAALRALVIQSLVGVITDPESKPGQITAAAKVLGTVTEVAAFTERKEVRTITSSETARAQVLDQLRAIVQGSATDATIIDRDADSLLAELTAEPETVEDEPHPGATPQAEEEESLVPMHTIPLERSHSAATLTEDLFSSEESDDAPQEDPPSSL
jgi:hypothetical protein